MGTLADHEEEYRSGLVSKGGFGALMDAEIYGNVASISALEKRLALLLKALFSGGRIKLFRPESGMLSVESEDEFEAWCEEYFPSASFENVRQR